ncbi:MAG: LuxR C-terminal-related transcriptional regulator [Massilibacteroides sp.]|nr:LuxR C-terminal-related transcriptional regulator [Massilibacteroides sp.]
MSKNKHIALILPDTIIRLGMEKLLSDFFSPITIDSSNGLSNLAPYDLIITDSIHFINNTTVFLPHKRNVLIINNLPSDDTSMINAFDNTETIIKRIQSVFKQPCRSTHKDANERLTPRETDILRCVAKGLINKEIAKLLNISLNTVLTHRKNISAKLGVKTSSGLTSYAIINGIISTNDL